MIGVVDCGIGNVKAFINAYKQLNVDVRSISSPAVLSDCSHIVLPGVGSFDHAMNQLTETGFRDALDKLVSQGDTPVLGVCIGMHVMANASEEGSIPGLGWVPGSVKKFCETYDHSQTMLIPHMGWNTLEPQKRHAVLDDYKTEDRFYFLHSYFFECEHEADILSLTEQGIRFASCVGRSNIIGAQFHPEKSHSAGLSFLKKFSEV